MYIQLLILFVNYSVCSGIEGDSLQPAEVPRFSNCTIVNGDLVFDYATYSEFM